MGFVRTSIALFPYCTFKPVWCACGHIDNFFFCPGIDSVIVHFNLKTYTGIRASTIHVFAYDEVFWSDVPELNKKMQGKTSGRHCGLVYA